MGFLLFEDDDLNLLYNSINDMQICFHHIYAPSGRFSVKSLFALQSDDKNVRIIADRNIMSPICEIATKGKLKDTHRMQKNCVVCHLDKIYPCTTFKRIGFI